MTGPIVAAPAGEDMGDMARLLRILRQPRRYRRAISAARAAQERGDWPAAAQELSLAVTLVPARASLLVQYGHASKEAGDRAAAEAAYRLAASVAPSDVDSRLHLGGLLRADGRDREAVTVFAEVVALHPHHAEARRALTQLGQRSLVAQQGFSRAVLADRAAQVAATLGLMHAAVEQASASAIVPTPFYDLFRKANPVSPPPEGAVAPIAALVLADGTSPAMLRRTLASLEDQRTVISAIQVAAPQALLDHPVASVVSEERGIAFHLSSEGAGRLASTETILVCVAGAIADPNATAWLGWAMRHGGSDLVYADHDRAIEDWRTGPTYSDPILYGAHDPYFLASGLDRPIMLLCDVALVRQVIESDRGLTDGLFVDRLIRAASRPIHLPRLLASRYRLPASAVAAAERDGEVTAATILARRPLSDPIIAAADIAPPPSIAIVIPTHNEGTMLASFVRTIRDQSAHPELIHVVIVDHRSDEPESVKTLAALEGQGATIVPFDAPFNWSQASNMGARAATDPLLVFANNDMEMLTQGWDVALRVILADDEVGVAGARLLYPDGTYQHAGVLFGTGSGAPTVHEGLGHQGSDPGPGGRWHARRLASAVTGAFLATRRSSFEQLGGFDEQFAIAYNDLDFCLRTREFGQRVIYCGDVVLTHYESLTRGRNVRAAEVAWDEVELTLFARRWGTILRADPGYNPQWALDGDPFDGFREPRRSEIVSRVRAGDQWAVTRLDAERAS